MERFICALHGYVELSAHEWFFRPVLQLFNSVRCVSSRDKRCWYRPLYGMQMKVIGKASRPWNVARLFWDHCKTGERNPTLNEVCKKTVKAAQSTNRCHQILELEVEASYSNKDIRISCHYEQKQTEMFKAVRKWLDASLCPAFVYPPIWSTMPWIINPLLHQTWYCLHENRKTFCKCFAGTAESGSGTLCL